MNIPLVSTESIAPARVLRQLQATSREVVQAASASVEVSLSRDGRLANLVERVLAGELAGPSSGRAARLLGESALFAPAGGERLPRVDATVIDAGSGEAVPVTRLVTTLQRRPNPKPDDDIPF